MHVRPKHALVVGGTGMLRPVAIWLAERGHIVSVIARDPDRLARLAAETGADRINSIALDYADDERLRSSVGDAVNRFGPLAVVVLWIRPGAPQALDTIARLADAGAGEGAETACRMFRVLGSAAADPGLIRRGGGERYRAMEGIAYREIVLGFRVEDGGSRWNTKDEIGQGVIDAIEHDRTDKVIGVVRPWERRPAR